MRTKILFLLVLIFISGCSTGYTTYTPSEPAYTREGPFLVTNAVDGDTLDLNNSKRVRLSGINTPETGECYYQEAKDKLKQLTLNKEVFTESDISNEDKYNRLLRYIYVGDTLVNSVLVKEGYARVYDKYSYDTRRYDELKEVEKIAINSKLGVWNCTDAKADCAYISSTNSKIYHKSDCKWAKRIQPENLVCFKSLEEVENANLEPCKTCNV